MNFDNISFNGTFREYQQRVLDNSSKFISDGKINIVAAPGSGKTILGLELIRRLNSPCIIFSPTTTIRQQWGQRFSDSFLNDNHNLQQYHLNFHQLLLFLLILSNYQLNVCSQHDVYNILIQQDLVSVYCQNYHYQFQ